MDQSQLNTLTNFIGNIADDVLRDIYVRGKYRDVILPMTGYEISFTRHFYKPPLLRSLAEISADIRALEQETEGLLAEITGGVAV